MIERILRQAIVTVRDKLPHGGSDSWITHLDKRAQLVQAVTDEYCEMAECDEIEFPFNGNYVTALYLQYRKSGRNPRWVHDV